MNSIGKFFIPIFFFLVSISFKKRNAKFFFCLNANFFYANFNANMRKIFKWKKSIKSKKKKDEKKRFRFCYVQFFLKIN